MTNKEISIKADMIKMELDLIKRSNLPQEVKDLAVLEAKRQIQVLKDHLEFNRYYEDVKNYIKQGKEEMKKFTLSESPMFSDGEFQKSLNETKEFIRKGKEAIFGAHNSFDEAMKNFWD